MHRYNNPPAELFIRNRENFKKQMAPNHIAVFFANDLYPTNADAGFRFEQNSNLYYLSGIDQEKIILVMYPDAPNEEWNEVLYIRETSKKIQVWEGWKYSIDEAREASGVEKVRFFDDFEGQIRQMLSLCDGIYIDTNEYERGAVQRIGPAHDFAKRIREEYPAHSFKRSYPIVADLRAIKQEEELAQMKEAIRITKKAFERVLKFVKPGVWEYEIEAEITHEFIRNRARGHAYDPIIATGENACVLHYIYNSTQCKDGDLLLMDFGADYGNYSSDLSRTIPVNGKFTQRQKDVYNACLRVHKAAKAQLVVGNTYKNLMEEVGKVMTQELIGLGLLTPKEVEEQDPKSPAFKKYFMHGNSHYMGLDTHDVGNRYQPFQPGMVYTNEPGIYILEENIGVRIENDVLITENGPVDLMEDIPIEVEEIEAMMAGA